MNPSAHIESATAKIGFARLCSASLLLALLAITLVSTPAAIRAQDFGYGHMEGLGGTSGVSTQLFRWPIINTCPVVLHARQSASAYARQVQSGAKQEIGQLLHLTVTGADSRRIVSANVTVRGFAGAVRMLPTAIVQNQPNAARMLDVRFSFGPSGESAAELRVPTLTAATSVQVNSVTYEDGSLWKLAAGQFCTAPVDSLMLVSGR